MRSPVKAWGLLILLLPALAFAPRRAADARQMTDDDFIESLGDASNTAPVDRNRLAKMFFSIAATLDGGKSAVQLLQGSVMLPDTSQQAVRALLRVRFEAYSESLATFKISVSELLDEPRSMLLFYRAIQEGQRSCWHFDLYGRLVETYGSGNTDPMSILSTREACGRLRRAAFQPRVEAIVRDALVEQVYQRAEINELKSELRDLEQLLADLQEIEDSE